MGIGCHCRYHGVSRTVLSSLILALLLFSGPSIAYGNFDATTIGTYGDITVMEVTGSYDANASDQQVNALPRKIIAQEFYSTHPDDYDFIVIYANFDFSMPTGAVAFYQGVRNDVQGIGKLIFDNSASYGSDGQLQGTIDMGNVANLESDPFDPDFSTTMGILCHELLHRWAAYVKFEKWDGTPDSTDLLGKDLSHWSYLLDTNGSLLYGNDW